MTVSSTTTETSYTGDGSTTNFATVFVFKGTGSSAELEVIERTIATGAEVTKTYSTHYTVTGGSGSTGTVIAATAPPATVEWHIRRLTTQTQTSNYVTNDPFPADTLEGDIDRLSMVQQEQETALGKAFRYPDTYTGGGSNTMPEPSADKVLGWNSGATALENKTINDDAYVTFPASSTDNTLPRFSGTTGVVVQGSGVVVDDSDNVTGVTTLTVDGDTSAADPATIGYTAVEGLILTGQGSTYDVTIKNDADGTVLGVPTGTTNAYLAGNLELGHATDTTVSRSAAGKVQIEGNTVATVSEAQTWSAAQRGTITALSDGANISVDMSASNNFSVTLAGNRTLDNPTNIVAGQSGSFFISQDGTGSRTLSFGSYYDFAGGTAPTLTATASAVDRIDYVVRTATSIHCVFTADYS